MEITRKQLEALISEIHDLWNAPEFDVREDYSGRGMYGNECIGFVTDEPFKVHGAICAILSHIETQLDCDGEAYDGPNWTDFVPLTDSMGLSSIVYYPQISIVDNDSED
jgi:hypothetical protein